MPRSGARAALPAEFLWKRSALGFSCFTSAVLPVVPNTRRIALLPLSLCSALQAAAVGCLRSRPLACVKAGGFDSVGTSLLASPQVSAKALRVAAGQIRCKGTDLALKPSPGWAVTGARGVCFLLLSQDCSGEAGGRVLGIRARFLPALGHSSCALRLHPASARRSHLIFIRGGTPAAQFPQPAPAAGLC